MPAGMIGVVALAFPRRPPEPWGQGVEPDAPRRAGRAPPCRTHPAMPDAPSHGRFPGFASGHREGQRPARERPRGAQRTRPPGAHRGDGTIQKRDDDQDRKGGGETPQENGLDRTKDGDEPQETERGPHREKGPPDLEPEPKHEKGELTEEAIEEGEKRTT